MKSTRRKLPGKAVPDALVCAVCHLTVSLHVGKWPSAGKYEGQRYPFMSTVAGRELKLLFCVLQQWSNKLDFLCGISPLF